MARPALREESVCILLPVRSATRSERALACSTVRFSFAAWFASLQLASDCAACSSVGIEEVSAEAEVLAEALAEVLAGVVGSGVGWGTGELPDSLEIDCSTLCFFS